MIISDDLFLVDVIALVSLTDSSIISVCVVTLCYSEIVVWGRPLLQGRGGWVMKKDWSRSNEYLNKFVFLVLA